MDFGTTAFIFLHKIYCFCFFFIAEKAFVYLDVRTQSLNTIQFNFKRVYQSREAVLIQLKCYVQGKYLPYALFISFLPLNLEPEHLSQVLSWEGKGGDLCDVKFGLAGRRPVGR
jgi:hypothetical protein